MSDWQFYVLIGVPVFSTALMYGALAVAMDRKFTAFLRRFDEALARWAEDLREDRIRFETRRP